MIPRGTYQKFTITLPSSNKKVEFRPFLVKEEKQLLIALEENTEKAIFEAIENIVYACTFEKISISTIPQIDAEFLFLNIRNRSMGEGLTIIAKCGCGFKNEIDLDMTKVSFVNLDSQVDIIKLSDSQVKLAPPSFSDKSYMKDEIELMARCMQYIKIGDETYDCKEEGLEETVKWLNDLSNPDLAKIDQFFKNLPKLVLDAEYTCLKCGESNKIHLEGLDNFFV